MGTINISYDGYLGRPGNVPVINNRAIVNRRKWVIPRSGK